MPAEVRDYVLCAYVYHCAPSVLDEQDENTVAMHWHIRNEIRKIRAERLERKQSDVDL